MELYMVAGRNDPCACGSGRKSKNCCGRLGAAAPIAASSEFPGAQDDRADLAPLGVLMNTGRYAELENAARHLLGIRPTFGLLWQLLGVALSKQGKDALLAWTSAARYSPEDPVAHLNMGNALGRVGRLAEAQQSYGRALALSPDFAEAHNNLGDVLLELGRFDAAISSCRRALRIKPSFAEAHHNLGKALAGLGRTDEAVASFRAALKIAPSIAEVYNSFGNALLRLARLTEAIDNFRQALTINPDFVEAQVNLSGALRSIGRLDEAIAGYRRALQNKPDFVAAHTGLAMALRLQGRTEESAARCRDALAIRADSASALMVLAELRADAGLFGEAEALFKRVIEIEPQSPEAWAGIAHLRRMTSGDQAWLAAAEGLAGKDLPVQGQRSLRYAIGKYFDDVGKFDMAFDNYRRANELDRRCAPAHDRAALTRNIDLIMRSHDLRWFGRSRAADSSARPVFIVGMLRSGTSLAEQILATHPAVFGAGEQTFWGTRTATPIVAAADRNLPEIDISDATLTEMGRDYSELLHQLSPDALRVVNKWPTNFLFLGLILAAHPHARIIHMRRNPIDTCLSIYFQHLETANTYSTDLGDLAHYYREYRRLMRHWDTVLLPGTMLEVRYENLVADVESCSRRMLEFIGLPWDSRCLDFDRTARPVVTASRWQVRQKIGTSSVERWRHYERFIGPLRALIDEESPPA
jgi:tetratricopeptide (TPR) repeat protein